MSQRTKSSAPARPRPVFVASDRLAAFALIALALVVYWPALHAGFIWDDDSFLTANPLIQAFDGLRRFWASTEPPDYFPLTSTSLWLEWRVWGEHAFGYHLVNVLLHATSVVLLWRLLVALEIPGAWLGAAIFAVHPVNVESVAWITERKNTLPTVFYLAALSFYSRFDSTNGDELSRRRAYWASLACFLFALLAKTSVVMLPVVLLGIVAWRRRRISREDLRRIAPFFALALTLGLVTVWYQSHRAIGVRVIRTEGLLERTLIAARAIWFYAGKVLAPIDLCFVYPRWAIDAKDWRAWIPISALAATGAVFWRWRASFGRAAAFAFGNYVLALLPVLGFLDIYFMRYSLVADHWQYLAMTVASAAIAASAATLANRYGARRALVVASIAALAACGVASWNRQSAFRDLESLWNDTLATNPNAWLAHNNLGDVLLAEGRALEAVEHFRAAARIAPDESDIHGNLGKALSQLRRYDEAAAEFAVALRHAPERAELHDNLGIVYQGLGRLDDAITEHREALRLDPHRAEAHSNLGNALASRGTADEAIAEYRAAIRIRPGYAVAHANLGAALANLGRTREAADEYREAVRGEPSRFAFHLALARALRSIGSIDEARSEYEAALRISPSDAACQRELALLRRGR